MKIVSKTEQNSADNICSDKYKMLDGLTAEELDLVQSFINGMMDARREMQRDRQKRFYVCSSKK